MRIRRWLGSAVLVVGGGVILLSILGVPGHPGLFLGEGADVSPPGTEFIYVGDGPARFEATVENRSTCGPTCRNMTASLLNAAEGRARNVTLHMRLTANGSRLWTGTRSIGGLAAGESYRLVQEADVGFENSRTVLRNDGYVTVWIEVVHAEGSETFRKRVNAVSESE